MSDDYTVQCIERFCQGTGKLICSPADYALASDWEMAGIPITIVLAAIDEWVDYNRSKRWLRKAPLEWVSSGVQMAYANWKRAVGPSYLRVN